MCRRLTLYIPLWCGVVQVSCTVTFDPATEGASLSHALDYFQYQVRCAERSLARCRCCKCLRLSLSCRGLASASESRRSHWRAVDSDRLSPASRLFFFYGLGRCCS
ncbi:unnamed protein product [Phaeothamnion confervicola]